MLPIDLSDRHALVMGVANHRSLSWAIARCLHQAGAKLCLTYAGERLKATVEELSAETKGALVLECDVTRDATIDAVAQRLGREWGSLEILVHGIALARKEDHEGPLVATPRTGIDASTSNAPSSGRRWPCRVARSGSETRPIRKRSPAARCSAMSPPLLT